jgi:hypothetical protein
MLLFFAALSLAGMADATAQAEAGVLAPKPLYRDSVYDGAADPVIVWNKKKKLWFMFYTNRRANVAGLDGVTWVHGTRIGIATSEDGAHWKYKDTADIQYRPVADYTHWAPEVMAHKGIYHMFLTYVPGVFTDWRHPRDIIHLTSKDLMHWKFESKLALASERVIDACVAPLPDGGWRMWYNNELDKKSIYYADSKNLFQWIDKGKAVGDRGGEGPKVFSWKGFYWMVVDNWAGLGVYRSTDMTLWTKQSDRLLETPGTGAEDGSIGGHPDVVVSGNRAYVYYFIHPNRNAPVDGYEKRRSLIQVTELKYAGGWLSCDRNAETYIDLNDARK